MRRIIAPHERYSRRARASSRPSLQTHCVAAGDRREERAQVHRGSWILHWLHLRDGGAVPARGDCRTARTLDARAHPARLRDRDDVANQRFAAAGRAVYYGKVIARRPSFIARELLGAFLRLRIEPGGYRKLYLRGGLSQDRKS